MPCRNLLDVRPHTERSRLEPLESTQHISGCTLSDSGNHPGKTWPHLPPLRSGYPKQRRTGHSRLYQRPYIIEMMHSYTVPM